MMKIRTQLKFPTYPFKIHYGGHILSVGSCFSDNIAHKLSTLKYKVVQNPTGITFNPSSILTTIKSILKPKTLLDDAFFLNNGLWSHPDFHGSFNHPDRSTAYNGALASLKSAHQALPHITTVFLTLGTSHVFRDATSGHIVNNCHKRPAAHFTKEWLSVETITQELQTALDLLQNCNENNIQFVLTVSPIRHIKNGLIADKLNKAKCLLAIHDTIAKRTDAHYFPAYELMIDDLRDYRYYAEDLIHPSPVAIDYIFDHFSDQLLDKADAPLRQRIQNIINRQNHRPLFPDTEVHQAFLKKLKEDLEGMRVEFPGLGF